MVAKRIMGIKDREFRGLARDSSCCKKNLVLEYYSRYVSHMTCSCIFRNEIFQIQKNRYFYLLAADPFLDFPKNKNIELFSMKKIFTQKKNCVKTTLECLIEEGEQFSKI